MKIRFILIAVCFLFSLPGQADEGMWMLGNLNKQTRQTMKELGLQMSVNKLYNTKRPSLKDAVVSFGGFCSGVVVSGDGLVFTNHHCGFSSIQQHSSVEHDYLKDGFVARNLSEELPNPELYVRFLLHQQDVTRRVLGAVKPDMNESERTSVVDSVMLVIGEEVSRKDSTLIGIVAAAFDHNFAKRLNGTHIKKAATRWEMTEQLREDIRNFKAANNCERIAVLWAASTEIYIPLSKEHESLAALEQAMKENNTEVISPSMCYAYAAIAEGAPFIMGAPNLCVDTPAMWEFSKKMNVPISGKDFKSGQTLMKTVLAPMFKTRMLGVSGWFSTNILGNRDGEVLDQPENFKTKEVSKLSVIDNIFEPEKYPDLYGDVYHKVRINYYPPRKDNKEAWDNIDIFGWMGYPMEIKVNFLCRDSILAAPIALDLVIFSDLALRAGMCGIQTWLSFFCKSPMHDFEHEPVHDLFQQWRMLKETLRNMVGETAPSYLD